MHITPSTNQINIDAARDISQLQVWQNNEHLHIQAHIFLTHQYIYTYKHPKDNEELFQREMSASYLSWRSLCNIHSSSMHSLMKIKLHLEQTSIFKI